MGLNFFSTSICDCTTVCNPKSNINPKPDQYEILKYKEIGNYLIIKMHYIGCTNFEGHKILVYENVDLKKLLKQKLIDPHFSESSSYKHPIARFIPTDKGWNMALNFVKTLL